MFTDFFKILSFVLKCDLSMCSFSHESKEVKAVLGARTRNVSCRKFTATRDIIIAINYYYHRKLLLSPWKLVRKECKNRMVDNEIISVIA